MIVNYLLVEFLLQIFGQLFEIIFLIKKLIVLIFNEVNLIC